jgi:ribosomal protein S18 acetylase RimI-like enzyme
MTTTIAMLVLRPAERSDDAFLRRLYASAREAELSVVGWSDAERDAFLRQQFDAQDAYYREHYHPASFDVIQLDGVPIGRLYVARWDEEVRVIDIALLPEHRGNGLGTQLLCGLLAEAADEGKRVSIHVEKHNPALRLYERLGFEPVADAGVYLLMEASP